MGYPPETALLVRVADEFAPKFEVQFDLPESNGHQWRSESHGVTLLVEKEVAEKLPGVTIDAEDGEFLFRK